MALKILLVDPDEDWLSLAKKYLLEQMYEVVSVNNGREAQLALYNDKFFAVILNYDTQNHSGLQVLKFIKANYTNQRIVMVINDQERIDSGDIAVEKLLKMGVTETIVRPFEMKDLKDTLEGHQSIQDLMVNLPKREGTSAEEEVQMTDENFTRIRIDEFYSSQSVLFDIYVKINANKYIKILHAGDAFSKERIDKYKNEKKVDYLYFHNNDRRKFIQYNNFLTNKIIENPQAPTANKVSMLKNVTEKFIEEAYTVGVKPQVIDQGKEVCETVYKMIETQQDLYKILKSYQDLDPSAYSHAFLVTLYSTAIIKQYEWQSKTTIETTAMACMFHDIGKVNLPKEIFHKKVKEMTPEQMEIYKQHPEMGYKILENNRMINNSIKQIILQHHENFDGTGFPFEKKGSKILTLANIVHLADDFVHLLQEEKLSPPEALKRIMMDREGIKHYNTNIIEKFIRVFVDPEKLAKEDRANAQGRIVSSQRKVG